jgi:tetrahydromethanopterin S-methyltransferase subunit G
MKPDDLEKVIRIQEKEITKLQEKIKEIEQKVSEIVSQFRNKGAI